MLVPDAIKIPNKARMESIGLANQTFMELMKDLPFMSFGIKIEAGITDDLRARLTDHLNANLKVNGGSLLPEDVFMVEQEPNLQRAYMLLSQKRRQREAQNFEQEMMKMKQQADGNTQTAVALEEEKRKTAEAEAQAYERKKMIDAQAKILEIREKAQWDLILMKYEKGAELTLQEEELVNNLMITEMTIAKDMAVAKMNAQNKERQSLASKKK